MGCKKDDDLRSCIGVRLKQDGVHAGVRVDEGGLRLHDLGAAHFVARRRDPEFSDMFCALKGATL